MMKPFGRRCGWCCVQLRWWQRNLCRTCKADVASMDGPPSGPHRLRASCFDVTPDRLTR